MPTTFDAPSRILAPTDLSESSELGLAYAAKLAAACGAELLVMVNINNPEREVLEEISLDKGISVDDAAELVLRGLVDRLAPDVPATLLAASGDFPAEGILGMAAEREADLIVIASHGRGGVRRLVLGSVAESVTRGAHCPVVVVPAHTD